MSTHSDVIIIGAGLAGLSAAVHLSKAGHRALLLERNRDLGGRARTDDLDGWLFNQGGHALYRDSVGHTELRRLGIEPAGEPPPLSGAQLLLDGQPTPLPIDAKGLMRTKALSTAGKLQFGKFMAGLGKLDPSRYANVTVDDWLSPLRSDVQAVAKAVVRLSTYAAATDILSAQAAITQLTGAETGVLYIHDGWAALCRELSTTATEAGATIESGAPVQSISQFEGGFAVTTQDRQYTCRSVVVAAGGPALTARLLDVDVSVFAMAGPAPEAAVLDLALHAMPSRHRFILGVDEPTYFSVHSPPVRGVPEGKVAAVAMRYIAPDDNGSADEHRSSLERIAHAAGADDIAHSRFLRRMTVTHGMPTAAAGGVAGRPPVDCSGIPGAYVAGDWVGTRGQLADAAIASGVDAASAAESFLATQAATTMG